MHMVRTWYIPSPHQEYFTKKMFSICDKDRSNSISLQEFCESLGKLMKQSDNEDEMAKINKDKLHFLFRIYDDDGLWFKFVGFTWFVLIKPIEIDCHRNYSIDIEV